MVRAVAPFLLALCALPAFSAMRIDQILNNYNPATGPGLPNYAIAQGSITIVKGLELSDRSTGLQTTYPLPKTLEGVTVEITIGGATETCILYYVLPQQLAFIVPSKTPVGTGTIKITNNGKVGTAPVTIVKSGFGILTLNGAGTGRAAAFFGGTANFVLSDSAANPDDLITLWGTGAGPFDGDETVLNTAAQDYTSIDTKVYVGGASAQVIYRGASAYPGLNQITFKVPAEGYSPGCYVSLLVVTNGVPSNMATIPVQSKGNRICSDSPAQNLLTKEQLDAIQAKGGVTFGVLNVGRSTFTYPGVPSYVADSATGVYYTYDLSNFNLYSTAQTASFGSCSVTVTPKVAEGVVLPTVKLTFLDAGPSLALAGNGNTATLSRNLLSGIFYYPASGQLPANFLGNSGGDFTFTSAGGPGVNAHTAVTQVPAGFLWTNEAAIAAAPVDRTKGVTVTWSNAPANTFVQITGNSSNAGGSATFICFAPSGAGSYTVPPAVLMLLPASQPPGSPGMTVATYVNRTFTASPLDYGLASGYIAFARGVTFQ